jgi:hypothetical protein
MPYEAANIAGGLSALFHHKTEEDSLLFSNVYLRAFVAN